MNWSRRDAIRAGALVTVGSLTTARMMAEAAAISGSAEQYAMFETSLKGPAAGNPFAEVEFGAVFSQGEKTFAVDGFYDGAGTYRLRFMPPGAGSWDFRTRSNRTELDGRTGVVRVTPARSGNHGPVRVKDPYRFEYSDGTPYREVGTTCYAWTSQPEALEEQTLRTLTTAPFNKLRMCVFPKCVQL